MSLFHVQSVEELCNYFEIELENNISGVSIDIFEGKSADTISLADLQKLFSILNRADILHFLVAYNSILRHYINGDLNNECKCFILDKTLKDACIHILTTEIKNPIFPILYEISLFLHLVMEVIMPLFQSSNDSSLIYSIFGIILDPNVLWFFT